MAIVAKKVQDIKVSAIHALEENFGGSKDFIFADYRGLTVEQITVLRKRLGAKSSRFQVVKNNFARIAFEHLAAPDVAPYLVGPTAVTIAPQDANEVAKILFEFIREVPVLKVKGALVGGTIYDAAQTEAFSKLPGKLELISMLMSVLNGPVRTLAADLNDINARLVRAIKALGDKKAEDEQQDLG
ncbi:MAG: 50S ribosomal protein L10 [Treponema sp.]|jgi:large subunit ribosomal protein L10|nr:50S ribosomal protein L10 [Treponema sp.]